MKTAFSSDAFFLSYETFKIRLWLQNLDRDRLGCSVSNFYSNVKFVISRYMRFVLQLF